MQNSLIWIRTLISTLVVALTLPAAALAGGENDHGSECLSCRLAALRRMEAAGERSRGAEFDDATGRSLLNYPPDRQVDTTRMVLRLAIADMNTRRLEAVCTQTFVPIGTPLQKLVLNAGLPESMSIHSVVPIGTRRSTATFSHEGQRLVITFEPPIPTGERAGIEITYTLTDPPEGLNWTPESPSWPGRPAQIHTQGQPESNRYWIPCHDFPNERMSTELQVTVPRGFEVLSNGVLKQRDATVAASLPEALRRALPEPGSRGALSYETFNWVQERAHVPYLITMVVGKFDIVDVGDSKLRMPVYAPLGKGRLVKQTYGRTPEMVRTFERLTGQPFPWDKYAQVIVHNFLAGGMENTSATTMYEGALLEPEAIQDGDEEGLISHELAHQWFGDLLTCNSWEHIWLNEGFATYFTQLWWESSQGPEAYLAGIHGAMHGVIGADRAEAPFQPAMNSKVYGDPWETFRRAANPYPKGASILHMLRRKMGDEAFYRGLAAYVARHRDQTVETSDFRKAMEEASGLALQRFFTQWCERPGTPVIDVKPTWDESTRMLTIAFEQTQNIDAYNPAFDVEVPVYVPLPGGGEVRPRLRFDTRKASITISADAAPEFIAVDPDLHVLADYHVQQSPRSWARQLQVGPTIAAKLQAASALGDLDKSAVTPEAASALAETANDSRANLSLRIAAISALGHIEAREQIMAMTAPWPNDAKLRRAVVDQLARFHGADGAAIESLLSERWSNDNSFGVRTSALGAMVEVKAPGAYDAAVQGLGIDSHNDHIRIRALESLAKFDRGEALDLALAKAQPGTANRTRPAAINAAADMAKFDRAKVENALFVLLDDDEDRSRTAAADGLVRIGDAGTLTRLDAQVSAATKVRTKQFLARTRDRLNERLNPPSHMAAAPAKWISPDCKQWLPLAEPRDWAESEEQREAMTADPAAFLAQRGLVAERWKETVYLFCRCGPDDRLWGLNAEWKVTDAVAVNEPMDGVNMQTIRITLDETGAALLTKLSTHAVGRHLAIAVDGKVVAAPIVRDPMTGGNAAITGSFSEESAKSLAEQIKKAGTLAFYVTVATNEVDEPDQVRAAIREHGPIEK